MALSAKTGSFDTTTNAAANNVVVTGVGFLPKVVIFWWTRATGSVDAIFNASTGPGMGWAVSTSSRSARAMVSEDAQTSSDTNKNFQNDACVQVHLSTTNVDGLLDFVSFNADGFTLVIDDAFGTSYRISYLALGGADITNVFAASGRAIPAATGNEAVTGVGFQPDIVFFAANRTTVSASNGTNAENCYGAAVSSSQQGILAAIGPTSATTIEAASYCNDIECIGAGSTGATASMAARATFVSMGADGFTLNWLEISTGSYDYLCIQGGAWIMGNLLTQTDTVTDIVESGFGFQPKFGMFFSHGQSESAQDIVQAHWQVSVGAFDSISSRVAQSSYMEDNTADSETDNAIEFDEVYINIGASDAVVGLMDVKSVDADGFTCIMDDADPTQAFVWYIAAGDTAAAGRTTKNTDPFPLGVFAGVSRRVANTP